MDWFNDVMTWLRKLRVDGFVQILVTAKESAEDMEVVAISPTKRQRKGKGGMMNLRKTLHLKMLKTTTG